MVLGELKARGLQVNNDLKSGFLRDGEPFDHIEVCKDNDTAELCLAKEKAAAIIAFGFTEGANLSRYFNDKIEAYNSSKTNHRKAQNLQKRFLELPEIIRKSTIGIALEVDLEALFITDTIPEKSLNEVTSKIEALERYTLFIEIIKKPIRKKFKQYYPSYMPKSVWAFEYTGKTEYRNQFDWKKINELPICQAFQKLSKPLIFSYDTELETKIEKGLSKKKDALRNILAFTKTENYREITELKNLDDLDNIPSIINNLIFKTTQNLNNSELFNFFDTVDSISSSTAAIPQKMKDTALFRFNVEYSKQLLLEIDSITLINIAALSREEKEQFSEEILKELYKIESRTPKGNSLNQITEELITELSKDKTVTIEKLDHFKKVVMMDIKSQLIRLATTSGVFFEVGLMPKLTLKNYNKQWIDDVDRTLGRIDNAILAKSIDASLTEITYYKNIAKGFQGLSNYELFWINKDLDQLKENYQAAQTSLKLGKYDAARKLFFATYESYHQKAVLKQFAEYQNESEKTEFLIGIGIITASAFLAGITASYTTGYLATTFNLGAKQLWVSNLLIESGVFIGAEKSISKAVIYQSEELQYHTNLGLEYIETVGMFGTLRTASALYHKIAGKYLFRIAEERLIRRGIIARGASQIDIVARRLIQKEMESSIRIILGNTTGAFGAEFAGFKGYDLLKLAAYDIAYDEDISISQALSKESVKETFKTLVALKIAGVLVKPVTKPIRRTVSKVMFERYNLTIENLDQEVKETLAYLDSYLNNVREPHKEDPSGSKSTSRNIEILYQKLNSCLRKRVNLVSSMMQAGLSTPEILAETSRALSESDILLAKVKAAKKKTEANDTSAKETKLHSGFPFGEILSELLDPNGIRIEDGSRDHRGSAGGPKTSYKIHTEKPARNNDPLETLDHKHNITVEHIENLRINDKSYQIWTSKTLSSQTFYLLPKNHRLESGELNYESILMTRKNKNHPERIYLEYTETTEDQRGRGLETALTKSTIKYLGNYSEIMAPDIIDSNPIYDALAEAYKTERSPLEYEKIVKYYKAISGREPISGSVDQKMEVDGPTYDLVIRFKPKGPIKTTSNGEAGFIDIGPLMNSIKTFFSKSEGKVIDKSEFEYLFSTTTSERVEFPEIDNIGFTRFKKLQKKALQVFNRCDLFTPKELALLNKYVAWGWIISAEGRVIGGERAAIKSFLFDLHRGTPSDEYTLSILETLNNIHVEAGKRALWIFKNLALNLEWLDSNFTKIKGWDGSYTKEAASVLKVINNLVKEFNYQFIEVGDLGFRLLPKQASNIFL